MSPQQLKALSGNLDYEELGTLPISENRVVEVAEQYMDKLGESLRAIFSATSDLSENVNEYFTYEDRSEGISAGNEAIKDSQVIAKEMQQQLADDAGPAPANMKEERDPTEKSQKRIALFPGKFKPPHKGHYDFVNQIARRNDVDEVVVLISPVDKDPVTAHQSFEIWSKFLKSPDAASNINIEIADYRSPVTTVYEFLADPVKARSGDTILLIKSNKDEGDSRFNNAQSYAEKHNPGVNIQEIEEDPIASEEGLVFSAEDLREMIATNDKEKFLTYMPENVDGEEVWNIFRPNEDFKREVDSMIDEMSSMAGGDVAGYAGGFGAPNTYNPYDRTIKKRPKKQPKRPKVSRAKRKRRR
jgi:nicotinamide mononucleotide adenylyltransferase